MYSTYKHYGVGRGSKWGELGAFQVVNAFTCRENSRFKTLLKQEKHLHTRTITLYDDKHVMSNGQ